ncbi:MAG: AMP-binding protein, partial [Nannocystaceae bacterium]
MSAGEALAVPHPLAAFARARPEHVALRVRGPEGVVGAPICAAALRRSVAALAGRLAAAGVGPGDRVALLGAPSAAWVAAFHAIGWRGACVAPIDPKATAEALRERLVGVRLLMRCAGAGASLPPVGEGGPPRLDVTGADLDPPADAPLAPELSWPMDQERVRLTTSGSSGAPKVVALTTANLLFAALGGAVQLGHHLDDAWHACLPPWHVGGLAIVLRTAWCQTTLDLGLGFLPAAIDAAIDRGAITQLSLVPAMLRRLVALRGGRRFPPTLRWILLGGAAADEADVAAAEALGATICPTWGMTESAAQAATRSPAQARVRGVVGPPLPFVTVARAADGRLALRG